MAQTLNKDSISRQWIRSLGANRTLPPDDSVLDTVLLRSGFDVRPLFVDRDPEAISEAMSRFPDYTFLRSAEEVSRLASCCPFDIIAPFGVSYNLPIGSSEQPDTIDVYGVCFAEQFANPNRVVVWCDHATVFAWESFDAFLKHWTQD